MQDSLLPSRPPEVDGWNLQVVLRPVRETSGDFYDFISLADGRVGLVIADVADKGMAAALYMALSRTLIRALASRYSARPDLALRAANERILADTGASSFVTVFYGVLEPTTGTLAYCNAGHHPPYRLSRALGDSPEVLPGRGTALGVVKDPGLGYSTVQLDPGDALLLYTDGIVDALNQRGERFGTDRMLEVAAMSWAPRDSQGGAAHEIRDGLLIRVHEHMGDEPQFDDITLIVLSRDG
jgi:sigma-B regulation protein RsbU (phosphoserine phosphatase)